MANNVFVAFVLIATAGVINVASEDDHLMLLQKQAVIKHGGAQPSANEVHELVSDTALDDATADGTLSEFSMEEDDLMDDDDSMAAEDDSVTDDVDEESMPTTANECGVKCEKKYNKFKNKGKEWLGFKRICGLSECSACAFCQGEPTESQTAPCEAECEDKFSKFENNGQESEGKQKLCARVACAGCFFCETPAPTVAPTPAPTDVPTPAPTPVPTEAPTISLPAGRFYLKQPAHNAYVGVCGGSNGCDGASYGVLAYRNREDRTTFVVESEGDNIVHLRQTSHTGYLGMCGADARCGGSKHAVLAYRSKKSRTRWLVKPAGDGSFYLLNLVGNTYLGMCGNYNTCGGSVYGIFGYASAEGRTKWQFEVPAPVTLPTGTFFIKQPDHGTYLGVCGGATGCDGSSYDVFGYRSKEGRARFVIEPGEGINMVHLRQPDHEAYLGMCGADTRCGSKHGVLAYRTKKTRTQWSVVPASGGFFHLYNPLANTYIGMCGNFNNCGGSVHGVFGYAAPEGRTRWQFEA